MSDLNKPGTRARYHDCLFSAISLDAEWTRRSHPNGKRDPKGALNAAFDAISHRCTRYKQRVEANLAGQHMPLPDKEQQEQEYQRWESMYHPLEYVPLGHDDTLSLMIFDDFDPFVSLTGQCPTTVEELSSGFLPVMESLIDHTSDAKLQERLKEAFADPYKMFHPTLGEPTLGEPTLGKPTPLLVFSRFKVNGLGSLGMGSLHQVALMRAVVGCIGQTLLDLEKAARGDSTEQEQELMTAFEIEKKDLKHTCFMMVDLLGQEEMGIVYFVTNWSVAAALNSRLQSLKFEEVLDADASRLLEHELVKSEWFDAVYKFYSDIEFDGEQKMPNSTEEMLEKIRHAHPLRWVRSTPAVRKDVFYAAGEKNTCLPVRGWIDATTHLRLAPGHQQMAQGAMKEAMEDALKLAGIQKSEKFNLPFLPKEDEKHHTKYFTIHQLGASDLALPHATLSPSAASRLVKVGDFLRHMHALMKAAGGSEATRGGRDCNGRHIVGAMTFCGIPVPVLKRTLKDGTVIKVLSPDYDLEKHLAVLELILPVLKQRIMLEKEPKDPEFRDNWDMRKNGTALKKGRQRGEHWGALSAANLWQTTRQYGVPQTLRRTLEFVYHNYTTLLANPLAFDSVLDLYDVFACFHRVLTEELPKGVRDDVVDPDDMVRQAEVAAYEGVAEQAGAEDYGPDQAVALDQRKLDMIARLIDAVHRALGHRMYRLFPENSHRDMDIDFRGGLNALVYSADGVVKLGLGVLRHHLLWEAVDDRARVGVVTRIGFRQGISAHALRLGVESSARLGTVETDVPHLYHLPSYIDFLHEAFHLVYDAARNPGEGSEGSPRVAPMLPTVPRDNGDLTIEGRLAEIFVNLLTVLFVCPDEPKLLAEHMVIHYATRNMRERDSDVLGNFIELTCLLHIVCRCAEQLRGDRTEVAEPSVPWWYCGNNDEEDLIEKFKLEISAVSFCGFLEEMLPYYSKELSLVARMEENEYHLRERLLNHACVLFEDIYEKRLKKYVPVVVSKVCLIYSRYWFRAAGRLLDDKHYKEDHNWLLKKRSNDASKNEEEYWEDDPDVPKRTLQGLNQAWELTQKDLRKKMDQIYDKEKPCYSPFSYLAWRDESHEKGSLDPMILLGVMLGEILRQRHLDLRGADGSGPHHLPSKDGATCFKDYPKVEGQKPRVFIQRGVSALFSSDLKHRARRLGTRITMLKMFQDMACRLRAKRLSEMLRRNLSEPEGADAAGMPPGDTNVERRD